MKPSAAAAALAGLVQVALGTPTISFPINAQVPPVARINQLFSFVFAANTFLSSAAINYTLVDAPSWLSLEADERWLHGTPRASDVAGDEDDVIGFDFGLVATDSDGATTLNTTLVVSRNAAPTVNVSIAQQLEESGLVYSEPSSLLYYPDSPLNFTFSPHTFSSAGLNYYAVSGDNSPLPSWIIFDADTLRFSGTTPTSDLLVEPPQTFNFRLIASDVSGFSATAVAFSVVVGSHEITIDDPSIVLNATANKTLTYTGLETGVLIDGQPASSANLTATLLSLPPDWLLFDNTTWRISGTPPPSAESAAFMIGFSDVLTDKLNVSIQVVIGQGTVFRSNLPNMQAQKGSNFTIDLESYLQTTNVSIAMSTNPDENWISLDADNLTITGEVPLSDAPSSVSISLKAAADGSTSTESQTFVLQILTGVDSANPTSTTTVTVSSTTTAAAAAAAAASTSRTSTRAILLAVLIPVLILCLVSAIVVCCYRRQHRKKDADPATGDDAANAEKAAIGIALSHDGRGSTGSTTVPPQTPQTPDKAYKVAEVPAIFIQWARNSGQTTDRESGVMGAVISEFPVPPSHTTPPRTATAGSDGATTGQWPFEESTLLSSASRSVRHGDLHDINVRGSPISRSSQLYHDAFGIPGDRSTQDDRDSIVMTPAEVSVQRVSGGTPAALRESAALAVGGRGLEGPVQSQEAIIDDGNEPSAVLAETRFSLNSIASEPAVTAARSHGILGGFAAKFTSRFKRSKVDEPPSKPPSGPLPEPPRRGPSRPPRPPTLDMVHSPVRSPVAPSEDSDYGSVTFGDVTMAKPFRPRPVFITSPNPSRTLTEEDEELQPPRSLRRPSYSSRTEEWTASHGSPVSLAPPQEALVRSGLVPAAAPPTAAGTTNSFPTIQRLGVRPVSLSSSYDSLDGENTSDEELDAAIRLDPPVPAFLSPLPSPSFLGPVSPQTGEMDLSQEIARTISMRSCRPLSAGSGIGGISAAMEEVRSLLLLPYDTPDMGQRGFSQSDLSEGMYTSSDSWVTLHSTEPNWTSVYDNTVRTPHRPLFAARDSTGDGVAFRHEFPLPIRPLQPQQSFVFPEAAYNYPVEESIAPEVDMVDAEILPGTYPESQEEVPSAPESLVENGPVEDGHEMPRDLASSPEPQPQRSFLDEGRGIGLAVSRYSQSHLGSHNSLTSRASSGVLAFI